MSKKLKISCPQCGHSLKGATEDMIGDTGVCLKCKAEFVIEQKMVQVDNRYTDMVIDELVRLVGVKERISYDSLRGLLEQGKTKECVEAIAHYLGLPISVVLLYVPSVYCETTPSGQRFTSTALSKTGGTGRGIESITAQVSLPSALPLFGSSSLKNYFVTVRVSDNVTNYPATFMTTMSHELSHVLLQSLQFKGWDDEVYTDITSMLLGFNEIVERGRKVAEAGVDIIHTITYGYLSDEAFDYAYRKISKLLEKNVNTKKAITEKFKYLQKLFVRFKENLSKFEGYIKLIDKSPRNKIHIKDAHQIVLLHQPHYIKKFEDFAGAIEAKLQKYRCYETIRHYKHNWHADVKDEINQFVDEAKRVVKSLENDLKVLKKNISFLRKLRITFKTSSNY